MALTAEQRTQRARRAALIRHSRGDTRAAVAPARRGFMARFEREVGCEALPLDECQKRAERAMRAHMLLLASKSAQVRSRANT